MNTQERRVMRRALARKEATRYTSPGIRLQRQVEQIGGGGLNPFVRAGKGLSKFLCRRVEGDSQVTTYYVWKDTKRTTRYSMYAGSKVRSSVTGYEKSMNSKG